MKPETIEKVRRLCLLVECEPPSLEGYKLNREILAELEAPAFEGTFEITLGGDGESATVDGEPVPLDEIWAKLVKAGQVVVPFEPPGYLGIEVTYPGPKYYRMSLGRTEGLNWTQFCHAVLTVLENHRAQRARDLAEETP